MSYPWVKGLTPTDTPVRCASGGYCAVTVDRQLFFVVLSSTHSVTKKSPLCPAADVTVHVAKLSCSWTAA
jgi:hypothetical protein